MELLERSTLDKVLNLSLPLETLSRFESAFQGLAYQSEYCSFHYEEFLKSCEKHELAMMGKLDVESTTNPQYYRIAFESHAYAFFCCLHALIESVPYLLNIAMQINLDFESRHIGWNTIKKYSTKEKFGRGLDLVSQICDSDSYEELSHLVNVSKHRRIPRIDSGVLSRGDEGQVKAAFKEKDLCVNFRSYNIQSLMVTIHDELHPLLLKLVNEFIDFHAHKS
ncbi:hypothetical protein [Vibrio metschnikovii]|uniref:Uncharacterized protein n=1 Tax=Vibrio metschnikovii TaxID=28172 RepID=A0A9X0RBU1_VIBME|nr:hypothetical protein [Vibrio metschnikovii]MBC5853507.1 hypothetical protein [Vibrio metschnikovii]